MSTATSINQVQLVQKCKQELDDLVTALKTTENEEQWTSILNDIQEQLKESRWGVLYVMKFVILNMESVSSLKNLMQIFVMKLSDLITENNVLKTETLVTECLAVLKDFWALCSNQHHAITKQVFGAYSSMMYDVLPSMASLYIDLFVASNRSKEKTEVLSKRLYGWLNMDLNERCLKTAFLEVSCTSKTASFLLPLLRKILLPAPPKKSFMDYLLHFVLLRRWAMVSKELSSVVQMNLNVKAPKNFVDWLCQRWPQAREHVPQDKSLKGRRVSEFMCNLDNEAVEELIDVFSQCLLSGEEQTAETVVSVEDGVEVPDLFVIDKKGGVQDEPPSKKRKKAEAITELSDPPKDLQSEENFVLSHSETKAMKSKKAQIRRDDIEKPQMNTDFEFGFVIDRNPKRTDGVKNDTSGNGENEDDTKTGEEEEEEMEVETESKDDADNDVLSVERGGEEDESVEDSDNDEVDNEDKTGEENGEDDDAESVGSDGKEVKSVGDSDNDNVDDEDEIDAEGVEEDDDSLSNDTDDDGLEEELENLESENEDVGAENKNTDQNQNSPTKTSIPAAFPNCVKDPALNYFVSMSPKKSNDAKESEIEIIDGMEIQTFETLEPEKESETAIQIVKTLDSVIDKAPKQLKAGFANDKNSGRKRKASESKEISIANKSLDSTLAKPEDSSVEIGNIGTNNGENRSCLESHSSASGKESEKMTKIGKSNSEDDSINVSSEEPGQRETRTKGSPTKATRLSRQQAETKQKSENSSLPIEIGDEVDVKVSDRRLRSESESSQVNNPTSSLLNRPHSTRKSKKVNESIFHDDQGQEQNIEGKSEMRESKTGSPGKKTIMRAGSPRKNTDPCDLSPKEKVSVTTDEQEFTEEAGTTLENTDKVTVTEAQVGFVLSQIRSSLDDKLSKDEATVTPARSGMRLRTKSESSDSQAKTNPKTATRSTRRQTLTSVKAKVDSSTPNSKKNAGSAKLLADWLRKTPTKVEVQAEEEGTKLKPSEKVEPEKTDKKLDQSDLWTSIDSEITFKRSPEKYMDSAKTRKGSPQKILIDTTTTFDAEPSQKDLDNETISQEEGEMGDNSKDRGENIGSSKTVKSSTPSATKVKSDVELKKTPLSSAQSKKTPAQRRKYYLRGTSPIKSPSERTENPLAQDAPVVSSKPAGNASSVQKAPHKSPSERRKSLRSSSKH